MRETLPGLPVSFNQGKKMSDSLVKINWSKKKGELVSDKHGSQQLP